MTLSVPPRSAAGGQGTVERLCVVGGDNILSLVVCRSVPRNKIWWPEFINHNRVETVLRKSVLVC